MVLLLVCGNSFAQGKTDCKCRLLVDPGYFGNVTLFTAPSGKVASLLHNDSANQDFLIISVYKDSGSYLQVGLTYAMSGKRRNGWIIKSSFIGTYLRSYRSGVPLYSSAYATTSCILQPGVFNFVPVLKCNNQWV